MGGAEIAVAHSEDTARARTPSQRSAGPTGAPL